MTYHTLYILVLSIIVTEAITELLVKSSVFLPLRSWLFSKKNNKLFKFSHSLLDCGYCTSVWVAFFVVFFLVDLQPFKFSWFIYWIFVHRVSNVWHFIIDRARGLQ